MIIEKESIHCIIPKHVKKRILYYGDGSITEGVIKLVKLVDSKEITVNIITQISLN